MFEIKGKVNTAICFASVVDEGAIEQIRRMCDYEMTEGSKIRIMPDVHAGKGCTIGTTMTIVDIAAHIIPSGRDVWNNKMEEFDLTALKCYRDLKNSKRLENSLGTLGGGNHFIEIDVAEDGTQYLVIHSGSRNLGKQVAELYQQQAIYKWQKGTALPSLDNLVILSGILGTTLDEIIVKSSVISAL